MGRDLLDGNGSFALETSSRLFAECLLLDTKLSLANPPLGTSLC